ncbi:MAG: hypothetical protein NTV54_15730 [Ignavibacteriales bacterium]|nr:hypothetical protein [Ignavibacteriales bacterium]
MGSQPMSPDSLVYAVGSFADTARRAADLTSDVDLTAEPGKILLARGDSANLALRARFSITYVGPPPQTAGSIPNTTVPDTAKMNPQKLGDNDLFSVVSIPLSNVGTYVRIDLQAIRRVSRFQVAVLGGFGSSKKQRPLAFTYYAGTDSLRMTKVYQELDNQDSIHTAYLSEPVIARFIGFVLDKQSTNSFTVISEIRVFGEGYLAEGTYTSKVDTTLPAPVNFGRVSLDADFSTATFIDFQMRTGNKKTVDSSWSPWSTAITFRSTAEAAVGARLNVFEPRRYFQYRMRLQSADLGTPKVNGLHIAYQKTLVADSTSAAISPSDVPVLTPARLTYNLSMTFSPTSQGVDTLVITTPSPSLVRSVSLNGTPIPYSFVASPDQMTIAFAQTIKTTGILSVEFTTKLLRSGAFPSVVVNKFSAWNPQSVDPLRTSSGDGWVVTTSGIPSSPLVDVRIDPNPFTPNGDGKNDATVIDFSVANVEVPKPLKITIFDLSGRFVRRLASLTSLTNPFLGDPRTGGRGFLWDGRDDNGVIVRPGVYLLSVSLESDGGGVLVTKTIIVAY